MRSKKLKEDQEGVVSLIVTIVIILILSLLVLAMSQFARTEQRQALDRQLSDQAFYNAESGINDTANYLYRTLNQVPAVPIEKLNNCDPTLSGQINNKIDGTNGVNSYTCILYTKAPQSLELQDLPTDDSKVLPIEALDASLAPTAIGKLIISWDDAGSGTNTAGCNFSAGGSLPQYSSYPANCEIGGVRVDLVSPFQTRQEISQYNINTFILPHASLGGAITNDSFYPDNQGIISIAKCNHGNALYRKCKLEISGLASSKMYLHIRSLYRKANVRINGEDTAGGVIKFNNAQVMVDATGKSSDVFKRVQVRLPIQPQFRQAEFGIQSAGSLCKILNVIPNSVTSADSATCPLTP